MAIVQATLIHLHTFPLVTPASSVHHSASTVVPWPLAPAAEKCCMSKLVYTATSILGANLPRNDRILTVSSSSSTATSSGDSARTCAPDSRMAGMIRAAAIITDVRYAKDTRTEGVMVMIAATKKL